MATSKEERAARSAARREQGAINSAARETQRQETGSGLQSVPPGGTFSLPGRTEVVGSAMKGSELVQAKRDARAVGEPVPVSAIAAAASKRNYQIEQDFIAKTGVTPQSPEEIALSAKGAYGTEGLGALSFQDKKDLGLTDPQILNSVFDPSELKVLGYSDEQIAGLSGVGQQANQAFSDLQAVGDPRTALGVLEEALNAKKNVTNQSIGQSELFERAGLPMEGTLGFAVLEGNLQQRSAEMQQNYNAFRQRVDEGAGSLDDALARYKNVIDLYNKKQAEFTEINAEARAFERELQLMDRQAEIQQELLSLKTTPTADSTALPLLNEEGASNGSQLNPLPLISKPGVGFMLGNGEKDDLVFDNEGNRVGTVTSTFGADHSLYSGEKFHKGIDIVFDDGAARAFTEGRIVKKGYADTTYGGFVWLQDSSGNIFQYGHLNVDDVNRLEEGAFFKLGAVIARHETDKSKMGASTGPHLDLRMIQEGSKIDLLESVQQRLSRANSGESKQVRDGNNEAIAQALATGDESFVKNTIDEVERKKFLPRSEKILTDFDKGIRDWEAIQNKFKQMETALKAREENPGTGNTFIDQALISLFNKITDPDSVVRESEFNRTAQSLSLNSRAQGWIEKQTYGGGGLTDLERKEAILIARSLANGASITFDKELTRARRRGEAAGVPDDFLLKVLGLNEQGVFPGNEQAEEDPFELIDTRPPDDILNLF